mmetsp:Transcript_14127/g.26909  ORF Transcript_14127/g.26909 Transcript_14127/m.26909 type:complete len:82 (-) Transcript_14127:564-809(-)
MARVGLRFITRSSARSHACGCASSLASYSCSPRESGRTASGRAAIICSIFDTCVSKSSAAPAMAIIDEAKGEYEDEAASRL